MAEKKNIRSCTQSACLICAAKGKPLYQNLSDRLFGAPGRWNLKQCSDVSCGLIWLDPMPLEEDIALAYQDYYTHHSPQFALTAWRRLYRRISTGYLARYGYRCHSLLDRLLGLVVYLHPGRKSELDFSVMHLSAKKQGRLLEIGCGSGEALLRMQTLGWQVQGVDLDPVSVAACVEKGLDVRQGTGVRLNFDACQFDAITLSHVIEHVHDPLFLINECLRVLAPGGRLVMVTPNTQSYGLSCFSEHWMALDPPRHLHLFSLLSMRRLMGLSDFNDVKVFSSVRDANGAYAGSMDIMMFGHHTMGAPQSRLQRLKGRFFQLNEWLRNMFYHDAGEELVMMAKKNVVSAGAVSEK